MLIRPIPSTGEPLPLIGLGSWVQFDVNDGSPEKGELTEVLRQMLQLGGTVLDTSPMYGNAEKILGELTQATGMADQFFYATKVWTNGRQDGIAQMEDSIRKLRRTTIDLMQIHNFLDWTTHLPTLRQWKEEGRIRYIGITHYTVASHAQLEEILRAEPLDFVQLNYSMGLRQAEQSLLPAAQDLGVAVLVNEPLEKAALFKKVRGKTLPPWAADYGIRTWAQFFLKFVISHPAVTCAIPGTSVIPHLLDNMEAGLEPLPDEKARARMAEYWERL